MLVKPIPSIPGAFAREDGFVKMPEKIGATRGSNTRLYVTKWKKGSITKSSKTASHCYYGLVYQLKNYKVHRLICEAFYGPPPFKNAVVIHINEDATDNRVENLKWGSQKENLNCAKFIEYCKNRTGENSPVIKGLRKKQLQNASTSTETT